MALERRLKEDYHVHVTAASGKLKPCKIYPVELIATGISSNAFEKWVCPAI